MKSACEALLQMTEAIPAFSEKNIIELHTLVKGYGQILIDAGKDNTLDEATIFELRISAVTIENFLDYSREEQKSVLIKKIWFDKAAEQLRNDIKLLRQAMHCSLAILPFILLL